ncbi:MAG TPA: NADPH-dependent assimilatory sulfite reductase hemoprotein subunit [Planctomycetaceae bacterium]|jgi:sulfite reductase (ferredoxin)|nr:NADPH-dependent assimilatory sulfite reductase hemoprotein subunit [Planctomycetaceae bacterium]
MSEVPAPAPEPKFTKEEFLKEGSHQLRGTIAQELNEDSENFIEDNAKLLKHHGTYQQDDKDHRKDKNADGTRKGKAYMFMVRTRVPGGKVTAQQLLAELDLCERYGNGTLRITSRQGLQLHGVVKEHLRETIRGINHTMLTTLAACGDVERNVMCCPAPYAANPIRREMQEMADRVAEHLKPRTTGYYEIWLKDGDGNQIDATEFKPVDEPIYGARYLPRKFKTAFALPEDNCVEIYSNDLGFLAIVEKDRIVGYNVVVGGGMGVTPSAHKTFPAVAKRLAFVTPEQVVGVAEAIVKVQRDFGNREDRKVARLKYLIANWGVPAFKAKVEEYFGHSLADPHSADVTDVDDHMGWHEQGDGKLFLGVNVECGRLKDEGDLRVKSAVRLLLEKYGMRCRLTPMQSLIFCDVEPSERTNVERILIDNGVKLAAELSPLRRLSIACPAFPTCGLSITESERVMPQLISQIETELGRLGIPNERIATHMTGCPNGCARPYTPDIGFVGKTLDKYTIFVGGNRTGTRLAFIYKDLVPLEEIVPSLVPLLAYFKNKRQNGESFGDFCQRLGKEAVVAIGEGAVTQADA